MPTVCWRSSSIARGILAALSGHGHGTYYLGTFSKHGATKTFLGEQKTSAILRPENFCKSTLGHNYCY